MKLISRFLSKKEISSLPGRLSGLKELKRLGVDFYLDVEKVLDETLRIEDIKLIAGAMSSENADFFRARKIYRKFGSISERMSLGKMKYYIRVIEYINEKLEQSFHLINPPEISKKTGKNKENKSLTSLLTRFRSLVSLSTKNSLLSKVISLSEFDEDMIQMPTFSVERLGARAERRDSNVFNSNSGERNNEQIRKFMIKTYRNIKGEFVFENLEGPKNPSEFIQVWEQFQKVDSANLRSKRIDRDKVAFKIKYVNEYVQGLSGPYRQFFSDITKELESSDKVSLLIPTPNNVNKKGEHKDKYTINPSCEDYSQYEFLGVLFGVCIRTGVFLPINLCSFIWKRIVNDNVTEEDLFMLDEGILAMRNELLKKNDKVNPEMIKTFKEMGYVNLSDGNKKKLRGKYENIEESEEERKKLYEEIREIRLTECEKPLHFLRKGLDKMIPLSILKFYTWEELELLICGKKTIDVGLLRQNTVLSDEMEKKKNLVEWFWEILDEFDEGERVDFVKFCYAQERLPQSQEEYERKQVQFTIKFSSSLSVNGLPHSDTCFFFLILPDYSTKENMKKMIKIAISLDNVGMNGDKELNAEGYGEGERIQREMREMIRRDYEEGIDKSFEDDQVYP